MASNVHFSYQKINWNATYQETFFLMQNVKQFKHCPENIFSLLNFVAGIQDCVKIKHGGEYKKKSILVEKIDFYKTGYTFC
jgi:hypothetical protein